MILQKVFLKEQKNSWHHKKIAALHLFQLTNLYCETIFCL